MKGEEFALKECPAYVPVHSGGTDKKESDDQNAVYETVNA